MFSFTIKLSQLQLDLNDFVQFKSFCFRRLFFCCWQETVSSSRAFFFYDILFQSTPLDFSNQYLAPGGKGTFGSWGKGSSGGTSTKPVDSGRFPMMVFYLFVCLFFFPDFTD